MKNAIATLAIICSFLVSARQAASQPLTVRVFKIKSQALLTAQREIAAGNKTMLAVLKRLRKDADKVLDIAPVSVMQKPQAAESGDKHDYLSLGRYWWPDPSKPDGLPYIQRDGETNPEAEELSDRVNAEIMIKSVRTLGLAYFFTADESYANHAAAFIRTWFLNPETRMNPNLNYGQIVKGKNVGRASGLIDVRGFSDLVDGVGLLAGSKAWTVEDQKALVAWFTEYLDWLQTSPIGLDELDSKNNHGVWFDVQRTAIALFVGKKELARSFVNEAKMTRISSQIEPDGAMPLELARTRSMHYTAFNLEAFFNLALLGDFLGMDLWNYQTPDGRGIRKALDWFYPYYVGEKDWSRKQIDTFKKESFFPIFHLAGLTYGDPKYAEAGMKSGGDKAKTDRILFMYGN